MNYKLTENKKFFNGETLYQIECVEDCKYAKKGDLGGYIASYDNLADGGWVHFDSCVCDSSVVKGYVSGGFVAKNSVVDGVVRGVVMKSFVDADSELDYAVLVDSQIVNTRYKAEMHKMVSTVVLIMRSIIENSELKGNMTISDSKVQNSLVNWNNLNYEWLVDNLYMIDYVDEDTAEVKQVRSTDKLYDEEDEELRAEWENGVEALLNEKEIKTEDEVGDFLFNENNKGRFTEEEEMLRKIAEVDDMADYYKGLFGEVVYEALMEMVETKDETGFFSSRYAYDHCKE